jgi:hypothetical protein
MVSRHHLCCSSNIFEMNFNKKVCGDKKFVYNTCIQRLRNSLPLIKNR